MTAPSSWGAAVMGTGIVSTGLSLDGHETLSRALLGICIALWLILLLAFTCRALSRRARWLEEARSPTVLTAIAGTAVLGTRLAQAGAEWAPYALLVLALCVWLGLTPLVLIHWTTPTVGASFLLTVATESLAVLAALLALEHHHAWLAAAALLPLVLGGAGYVYVLARFDPRQLLVGRGDHWVAGGALAIVTLACAGVAAALGATDPLGPLRHALDDASLALWIAAVAWLPLLLVSELAVRRPAYDDRRWSTVFPFGMYAVCSFATAHVSGVGAIATFARVWIWIAFALWAAVFAGALRDGLRRLESAARTVDVFTKRS